MSFVAIMMLGAIALTASGDVPDRLHPLPLEDSSHHGTCNAVFCHCLRARNDGA